MHATKMQRHAEYSGRTFRNHERNALAQVAHQQGNQRIPFDPGSERRDANVGQNSVKALRHQKDHDGCVAKASVRSALPPQLE